MNLKTLIHGLFLLIFALSCSKPVVEPEQMMQQQYTVAKLKSAAISTNYYVSKSGNDRNAGTIKSPFLTIQKAALVVNPGDNVIVDDGEYSTSESVLLTISHGGNEGKYITFMSKNKWGAVLNGNMVTDYAIKIEAGASYIKFIDFEIKNFLIKGYINNEENSGSSYITIQGNKIRDIGRLSTTRDIGICAIKVGFKSHHWNIDNNIIYDIGRTGPDNYWLNKDHAIYTATTSNEEDKAHHINITNNIIWGCSGVAINCASNNDLIANNIFAWTNENSKGGSNFIATETDVADLTIANNIFYQPPVSNPYAVANLGRIIRWTVKNNIVYGGRMWEKNGTDNKAAMAGGNYGRTDCEKNEMDPKFVSALRSKAPNVDFSFQASSPVLNAGVEIGVTSSGLTGHKNNGDNETPDGGLNATQLKYYNTPLSESVTKDDCEEGYRGSTVTYTVEANKYTSTLSQEDADHKALEDMNNNKQAYANKNGSCSKSRWWHKNH